MRIFGLLLAVILVAGCQAPASDEMTAEEKADVERQVVAVLDGEFEAVKALDLDRANGAYSRGLVYAHDGVIETDWAVMKAQDRAFYGSLQSIDGTVGEKIVRVLGPEAAVVTAPAGVTFTDTAGVQMRAELALTWVLSKSEDGWKIVVQHNSTPSGDE